jgi:hypothetical protein
MLDLELKDSLQGIKDDEGKPGGSRILPWPRPGNPREE